MFEQLGESHGTRNSSLSSEDETITKLFPKCKRPLIDLLNTSGVEQEDQSIVSAYEKYGICVNDFTTRPGAPCDSRYVFDEVQEESVDYTKDSPKQDRGRIEIAGGREIFTKSRMKTAAKKDCGVRRNMKRATFNGDNLVAVTSNQESSNIEQTVQDDVVSRVCVDEGTAGVIGNVPIACYEGSPRRYGGRLQKSVESEDSRLVPNTIQLVEEDGLINHQSNGLASVTTSVGGGSAQAQATTACLLLSELLNDVHSSSNSGIDSRKMRDLTPPTAVPWSEERSGSQENSSTPEKSSSLEGGTDFADLDYHLSYRSVVQHDEEPIYARIQQQPLRNNSNNASSGSNNIALSAKQRAPQPPQTLLFPSDKELLMLHEQVHQHTLQVEMISELDDIDEGSPSRVGIGGYSGPQVPPMRHLTLSPTSTTDDCDTVDSDLTDQDDMDGLVSVVNSIGSRLMPVLEDGLSSGHASDSETAAAAILAPLPPAPPLPPCTNTTTTSSSSSSGTATTITGGGSTTMAGGAIMHHDNVNNKSSTRGITMGAGGATYYHHHHNQQQRQYNGSGGSTMGVSERNRGYTSDICRNDAESAKENNTLSDLKNVLQQHTKHREPYGNNKMTDSGCVSPESKPDSKENSSSSNVVMVTAAGTANNASHHQAPPVWIPRNNSTVVSGSGTGVSGTGKNDLQPPPDDDCDTDQETDRLLGEQRSDENSAFFDDNKSQNGKKKGTSKEAFLSDPQVLIEGVLFRARYLGSTQLVCEGQPTKATRMMQAEEAVARIKAPEGETQPSTEVDLFISTEKIMVLNTDLKEIMMDHSLRTISYIADIGDVVVLMARRRPLPGTTATSSAPSNAPIAPPKMICHVFESDEAQFIAQSIGQAFQVAYMEFLKANGIEDSSFIKEMDYQEVLNSQEIFGNELEMFAKKDRQKEVVVPKQKGEILGMVIVESGWGSMLPTVVVANMAPQGPAARCGLLNIGDQIIAINGVSLVGLPLSTCQAYIRNTKHQTVVKLTVVPCAPVVEVKIKRPDAKYQLGFSVQNGVICSLLRGGIAERGGVRVGHRIIEINGQSVVAVPHEKIVNLLATSVGEIHMKTMPTSMFRLLTGQESPVYI